MRYDVVVVDTGVNLSHPQLLDRKISSIQILRNSNGEQISLDSPIDNDDVGHGTAICNITQTSHTVWCDEP